MIEHKNESLWDLTRGHRLRYASALACLSLGTLFLLSESLVQMAVVDGVLSAPAGAGDPARRLAAAEGLVRRLAGDWGAVPTFIAGAVVLVLFSCVAGVFFYLRSRQAALASEGIIRRLRDHLYSHLERLPCSFHDAADTGDLVQRCTSDVETVRTFLSAQVVEIGRAALMLLVATPILLWIHPKMALAAVATFPVIIGFAVVFFRKIKHTFKAMDEAEAELTTVLQENLTGIRVVRAFAQQDYECEKFGVKNRLFRDRNFRLIRLLGIYWPLSDLICFVQIGLVLGFGAWFLLQGELSGGALVLFIQTEGMMMWPVRQLGRTLTDSGKAIVSLGRLRSILAEPIENGEDEETLVPRTALTGALSIRDLRFRFPGGDSGSHYVLDGIDVDLAAGETLAILGPPGSGKSTLVQLLMRLYDYEEGEIHLDGHELRTLGREYVRSQIGVVLQEPFLYSTTIGSNIHIGRTGATAGEVSLAAQTACVHDAICEFDEGYETLVGERGVTLSGGQRQRVSLARALLKDPPILVLDDSLSAVDTKTEAHILDALRERQQRRTTIIITHRLSSILHADKIVVLAGGRVAQIGTHRELIGAEGVYRRLWDIQGTLEEEIEEDLSGVCSGGVTA